MKSVVRALAVSDEQSFLEAICDDPENEDIRLVFADWCEEHADPRGEFIRVQLALDKLPPAHPWREEMEELEARLWKQHRKAWNAPVYRQLNSSKLRGRYGRRRQSLRGFEYARGFIERLRVEAATWIEHWDMLRRFGPIRQLKVYEAFGWMDQLAECPGFAQIVHLDVANNQLGDVGLKEFLEHCPPNLKTLNISGNRLTTLAAGYLIDRDLRAEFQHVVVSDNPFEQEDIELLCSHFGDRLLEESGSIVGRGKLDLELKEEKQLSYDDHHLYEDGCVVEDGEVRERGAKSPSAKDPWNDEHEFFDFYREEDGDPSSRSEEDWWHPPEDEFDYE